MKDFHSLVEAHGRAVGTREYLRCLQWPNVTLVYRLVSDPEFNPDYPFPNAVAMADTDTGMIVLSVWDTNAAIHHYREDVNDSPDWEVHNSDDPLFGLFELVCRFLEASDSARYHRKGL